MEISAVVQGGQIHLPASISIPDGTLVRVVVDDGALGKRPAEREPLEREPLDEDEVMADLRWATGRRFS